MNDKVLPEDLFAIGATSPVNTLCIPGNTEKEP